MMDQPNPQFSSRSVQIKAAGPLTQILSVLILLALIVIGFVIGFIILIPLAILALLLYGYFKIKRLFAKTHAPNGPLDGRRNVRVVDRDE